MLIKDNNNVKTYIVLSMNILFASNNAVKNITAKNTSDAIKYILKSFCDIISVIYELYIKANSFSISSCISSGS